MNEQPSRTRAWLMAARPHTLPAAASPVTVGIGMAFAADVFAPLPALAALLGAELIQIGTNFANDYFDAIKGADTDERDGFTRVTQSGLIPPQQVKLATMVTYGLAFLIGVYLVAVGGVPIVIIGLASILAGITYTGGPYPFGYHGLGDLFVFVFFGVVAVTGTYYVQAASLLAGAFPLGIPPGTITRDVIVASLPMGALNTAILVINNVRDIETDRATGKITLAVRLGYNGSRLEYLGLLAVTYLAPLYFLASGYGVTALLPLLTLPYAASVWRTVRTETTGDALDPALERTGKLLAMYAILFAIGVVL
ncbi:1,4-dihydroxy-2-naphthoate polyprenyltransferase [Halanaeroarchaeum sulfurireducens]|uniref:1,4-dihydroxy-2-naphthoate polyprenyltransferase n=1 Tax=Halanaeroarchaeum sulfurireducens TaxID=1604004 RepID=UPI0006C90063|nr:1,4-dihydroxy-2-naphthoate polyprenyltransferase [Halanaeroarchaeum sulfurireducens]